MKKDVLEVAISAFVFYDLFDPNTFLGEYIYSINNADGSSK